MLKVCIQSSVWYREEEPNESLKMIRECGFEGIDYNIDNLLPGKTIIDRTLTEFFNQSELQLQEYFKPLKEAAGKNGVKIAQMHAPCPLYLFEYDEINDYMIMVLDKCCAVCHFLGCPALVVHPFTFPMSKEREKEINLQMYRKMIPSAKKYGITLCLENMHASYQGHRIEGVCADVSEVCWYIDTLNAEAGDTLFGYCLDVGHANMMRRNITQYIKQLGERLVILHIHDNTGVTDSHMIPYTQDKPGNVDWEGLIEGLRDINYKGTLSFETYHGLEMFPKEIHKDVLSLIAAIGHYFKRRVLDE